MSVKQKGKFKLFALLVMKVPGKDTNYEDSFKKTEHNILPAAIMERELQIDL